MNYLSNGINILAGDDPVPVKFWPKGTDPQYDGCTFHVSHAARCAVSDSRPSCLAWAGKSKVKWICIVPYYEETHL